MRQRIADARLDAVDQQIATAVLIDKPGNFDLIGSQVGYTRSSISRHMRDIVKQLTEGG